MHDYITITQAAKLMRGRRGKAPSICSIRRWANPKRGCWPRGLDGPQLFLRSARVNGELLTTAEWVAEFERERVRLGTRQPVRLETNREARARKKSHERAVAELEAMGLRCG